MRTSSSPRIAYDDIRDEEPAFLFLPGWCARRDVFRPLYEHLQRRAIALDWRGHGGSEPATADFGTAQLVEDALAVVEAAGVERFIPVATAHAGFIAIELRRRLGEARVPGIVLVDWMVLGAPPPFYVALAALQKEDSWAGVRAKLFEMWTSGVEERSVHDFVATMATFGFDMWSRAGREIAASFAGDPVPLDALDTLACPVLHLYAQPADAAFLAAQERYRASHPWFEVKRVAASSHFPMLEVPAELGRALEAFARTASAGTPSTIA